MATRVELQRRIRRYREFGLDAARWVCLNPRNAEAWRREAARYRALEAAALEKLKALGGRGLLG